MLKSGFFLLLFIIFPSLGWAVSQVSPQEVPLAQSVSSPGLNNIVQSELFPCQDDELGVRLLCNPEWQLETDKNATLLIISSNPAVTLTIAKQKSPIVFIEQLNPSLLMELGQYKEGFQIEEILLAHQKAIKVKGFYEAYPEIRLLDYYLVHDSLLYMIYFSVNPKESWEDYQFLFKKIIDSLSFVSAAK